MERDPEPTIPGAVIWVTRPENQSALLCEMINNAGGRAVQFPVIEIIPLTVPQDNNKLQSEIETADIFIFVSRNAVLNVENLIEGFFSRIRDRQILAIGAGTKQELSRKGLANIVSTESGVGSEALLDLEQLQPDVIAGKNIVIVRGVGGRDKLEKTLQPLHVSVRYLEVYQRKLPDVDETTLAGAWELNPPDVIVVTSIEGLQNLFNMTVDSGKERLLNTQLVVMSRRIRQAALDMGFVPVPVVATDASDEGLIQAINSIFEDN